MGQEQYGQGGEVRMKPEAFVADWKRSEVSEIQEFVQSADVVGLLRSRSTAIPEEGPV